jgi:serine/threonine protein kinase
LRSTFLNYRILSIIEHKTAAARMFRRAKFELVFATQIFTAFSMKELSLTNTRLDGRYEIHNELGRGSYAEIFVARDTLAAPESPHKLVVIKALNVFLQNDLDVDLERTLVENFQNEAIALDRVRHPNIISRLGHGTARDLRNTVFHYLVLEYLPGGDLARACREKNLSLQKALFYLEQVCAGLAHAHEMGVIHRDIKPQNLLLTADKQTVKIADFGVARTSVAAFDAPVTRVGTNMFAPPEHSPMFSGNTGTLAFTQLTPAADIYSLAKSAYVLITCESPRFFSNQPIIELPFAVRQEPWAKDLVRILERATQNDSRERYQTVNEFWRDLSVIKKFAETEDAEVLTKISERAPAAAIPQAHVAKGYTPFAPQMPHFKTTDDIKSNAKLSPLANAPLVVKVGENNQSNVSANAMPPPIAEKKSPVFTNAKPPSIIEDDEIIYQTPPRKRNNLLRRSIVFLTVVALFAGVLYATSVYLRGRSILPNFSIFAKQQIGVANTDVNLRPAPTNRREPVGVVYQGSKVRIVNTRENWYEVQVTEYGRPKENNDFADSGWVYAKYIDVQE